MLEYVCCALLKTHLGRHFLHIEYASNKESSKKIDMLTVDQQYITLLRVSYDMNQYLIDKIFSSYLIT